MAEVVFDADEFRALFPHLKDKAVISDDALASYFSIAADKWGGTGDHSPWPYDLSSGVTRRRDALYAFTCHLATISLWPAGQSGPVQSAGQGSVNTSFAQLNVQGLADQWYAQTPCGQMFLVMYLKPLSIGGRLYGTARHHPWN